MTDDDRLLTEINAQAEFAYQSRPKMSDALALARALECDFPHRSVDEIEKKIKSVWRAKGLFWRGE
jgi:hypothetical protein